MQREVLLSNLTDKDGFWAQSLETPKRYWSRLAEFVDRRRSRLPLMWRDEHALRKWQLSSFRPRLQKAHEPYVRYLVAALRDRSENGPRNIALSAGYGLGKSSVMRGVVRAFPRRVVHVTLGSLKRGVGARSVELSAQASAAEIQSVQQEVVKQLLYSAKQARLPRSRFRRLDRFRLGAALPIVVPIVGLALLVVYNNGLASRIEQLVQSWAGDNCRPSVESWAGQTCGNLAEHIGGPVSAAYVLAWIILTFVVVCVIAALSKIVRIGKVSAGSNSIELTGDDKGSDYFDRYLDEIVYFFQETRRDIVVFEDIDRFGNAAVFEELRELNTLLNQADQVRRKPVRFLYSVRDSLFDDWPSDSDSSLPISLRRATQRMKFFDLVVPMVPTITHRTARDVLSRFRYTYPDETLSEELVQEVARHVPDMRVLTGILNEFKVFRSLSTGPDQPELEPNESFAVLVYKVHESADFELVQFNESKLDKIFDHAEAIIQARATEVAGLLRQWDDQAEALKTEKQYAQAANHRLIAAIGEQLSYSGIPSPQTWFFDGDEQPSDAPNSSSFWQTLLDGDISEVRIANPASGRDWTVPAKSILAYADVSGKTWGVGTARELKQRHEALLRDQRMFARATWAELYNRTDLAYDDETFAQKVQASFRDPIVPRLIELGHLTEAFYLHASVFYGDHFGKRATTFLHKYVNRRQVAMDFVLDNPADVLALVKMLDDGFLGEQDSALNISLVDVIVEADQATPFFSRYSEPSDLEIEFANAYLQSGMHSRAFMRGIAEVWIGAIDFAVRHAPETQMTAAARLTDVLSAADSSLAYYVEPDQLEPLRREIKELPLLREVLDVHTAERIAAVLSTVGVEIDELALVTDTFQTAIRDTGRFALTYENLSLLGGGSIALDSFMAHEEVLRRIEDGIDEYVRVLDTHSAVSVADAANFEAMIERFESIEPDYLEELGKRAVAGAHFSILDKLAPKAWGPIIRAGRVTATMKVVEDYLDEFGVDETLLDFLAGSEKLDSSDAAQATRRTFAFKLIAADGVPVADRARLVESLLLDQPLAIDEINIDSDTLPGALLAAGVIDESEESLRWAHSAGFGALQSIFGASPVLAKYIAGIAFNGDELEKFFDEAHGIPESIRVAVHNNIGTFEPSMTPTAWRLYASWVARTNATIPDARMVALSGNGASTEDIIDILVASFGSRDPAIVGDVLRSLGGKFARITTIAKGSETFDKSDRMAKLAALLVSVALVSSWRRTLTNRVQIFLRQK